MLFTVAVFSGTLNYVFDGSGADYMTLRYGNGNPFAFLLNDTPVLYYLLLIAISILGISLVLSATIGITKLVEKIKSKKALIITEDN